MLYYSGSPVLDLSRLTLGYIEAKKPGVDGEVLLAGVKWVNLENSFHSFERH